MLSSHVVLCPLPATLTWATVRQDLPDSKGLESTHRIFYDEYHQQFVKLGIPTGVVCRYATSGSLPGHAPEVVYAFRIPEATRVRAIRFNSRLDLFVVLIDESEIRLYDANAGLLLSTKSPKNRAVQILSVHWLVRHPYTFFLVTSHGVEMYESNDGGKSCKLTKAASYPNVCHFWYLASTGTLLVVDMKGVFQSYRLRSAGIHRICKFELDANQSASKWSFAHISLVCLYGRVYCVYLNEAKGQLHLLWFSKDSMKQTHVFDLYSPGKYEVSELDNLLVVHNLSARVAVLFDVRTDSSTAISAPLPLSFAVEHGNGGDEKTTDDGGSPGHAPAVHGYQAHYYEHWRFVGPRFVVDSAASVSEKPGAQGVESANGTVWELDLSLDNIVASWPGAAKDRLVDFLLKRSSPSGKRLLFNLLQQLVQLETPLPALSKVFHMLNRVAYDDKADQQQRMLRPVASAANSTEASSSKPSLSSSTVQSLDAEIPSSVGQTNQPEFLSISNAQRAGLRVASRGTNPMTSSGYLEISQRDICNLLFTPLKKTTSSWYLLAAVTEFLRCVYRFHLNPEPELNDLLVELLISEKRFYEFHQHLQYHVLSDSIKVAKTLLELGASEYPPAYQLGLDMLFRLNAHAELLQVLLSKKEVLSALRLVSHRSPLFKEAGLRPADFLEAALMTTSTDVFYATFKFFEARNAVVRNSPYFIPEDNCEKYVIHFNHLFGAG